MADSEGNKEIVNQVAMWAVTKSHDDIPGHRKRTPASHNPKPVRETGRGIEEQYLQSQNLTGTCKTDISNC